MRRSELLSVVDLTTASFNILATRDLLPLPIEARQKGWRHYDAEDALRIALFLRLTAFGVSQHQACALVRSDFEALLAFAHHRPRSDCAILFGRVQTEVRDEDSGARAHHALIAELGGTDEAVAALLARLEEPITGVVGIAFVSATAAMDDVHRTAVRSGALTDDVASLARLFRVPSVEGGGSATGDSRAAGSGGRHA